MVRCRRDNQAAMLGLTGAVFAGLAVLMFLMNPPLAAVYSQSGSALPPSERWYTPSRLGALGLWYAGQTSLGPQGTMPYGIAYDNRTGEMFVTEAVSYVAVLSGTPPTVVDSVYLGANTYPEGIAYDGANDSVFVGTSPNTVVVISGTSHAIEARVNVGFEAVTLAYDPATGDVYAGGGLATFLVNGSSGNYNVTVINGTTYAVSEIRGYPQVATLYPFAIAYDPVTRDLVVLGTAGFSGWNGVAAFDPITGKPVWDDSGNLSTTYSSLAVDSKDGRIFLPNFNTVSVLNGTDGKTISQFNLGGGMVSCSAGPAAAYDPRSANVLVGEACGKVQAINTSTEALLAPVSLGGTPAAIAVNTATGNPYVALGDTSSVAVLASNGSAVVSMSNVGGGPNAIAVDNASGTIYVASSDNVSVVKTTTHQVVATIPVGASPEGILYDPASNELFVANTDSNTVAVISARMNTVVATVPVDPTPWALAWNSATDRVYVTCMNLTGTRAFIDEISARTLKVVATISLGSLSPDGIAYVPALNEIFVDNNPLIYYPPLNLTVISAVTNRIVAWIPLPAGAAPGQIAFDSVTGDLYIAGAGFVFNGSYLDDIVVNPFTLSVVATIPIGFDPYGIAYEPGSANLFATAGYNGTVSVIDGTTSSVSSSVCLPAGTFPQGVASDPSTHQVFVADWGNDSVSYLVAAEVYPVTFTESGLPSGTGWWVNVTGGPSTFSDTNTLAFSEPNGTYLYSVSTADQTYSSPGGSFPVDGVAASETVTFSRVTYTVTFTESGLPSGTGWSVTLNGATEPGTGTIAFAGIANGTYGFTIGSVTGYTPTPSVGSIAVKGPPAPESIAFMKSPSPATFLGLPGTEGYAVLGGIVAAAVLAAAVVSLWSQRRKTPPEPAKSPGQPGQGGPPGPP